MSVRTVAWLVLGVAVVSAVLTALVGLDVQRHGEWRRERRRLEREAAQLVAQVDSLQRVAARVDTVYRTKWLPRWEVVRDSLPPVTPRESVVVAIADSTIRTCTLALDACQRAGFAQDSLIGVQRAQLAWERQQPKACRFLGVRCELVAGVAGFVSGLWLGSR